MLSGGGGKEKKSGDKKKGRGGGTLFLQEMRRIYTKGKRGGGKTLKLSFTHSNNSEEGNRLHLKNRGALSDQTIILSKASRSNCAKEGKKEEADGNKGSLFSKEKRRERASTKLREKKKEKKIRQKRLFLHRLRRSKGKKKRFGGRNYLKRRRERRKGRPLTLPHPSRLRKGGKRVGLEDQRKGGGRTRINRSPSLLMRWEEWRNRNDFTFQRERCRRG